MKKHGKVINDPCGQGMPRNVLGKPGFAERIRGKE